LLERDDFRVSGDIGRRSKVGEVISACSSCVRFHGENTRSIRNPISAPGASVSTCDRNAETSAAMPSTMRNLIAFASRFCTGPSRSRRAGSS